MRHGEPMRKTQPGKQRTQKNVKSDNDKYILTEESCMTRKKKRREKKIRERKRETKSV